MSAKKGKVGRIPTLDSDAQAEEFIANADLTQYDLSEFRPVRFEFEKKTARINMRLPQSLLDAIKKRARERGMPYQRYIREVLEHTVTAR